MTFYVSFYWWNRKYRFFLLELNDRATVIFDLFNKKDFENKIKDNIKRLEKIDNIIGINSRLEEGLQFIDNLCSVIRLHKSKTDKYNFYTKIEKFLKEIWLVYFFLLK